MLKNKRGGTIGLSIALMLMISASIALGYCVAEIVEGESLFVLFESKSNVVSPFFQASQAYTKYLDAEKTCAKGKGISMAPALFPGNTLCYAEYDSEIGITEGDIIIYEKEDGGGRVAHAVISIKGTRGNYAYVTMGYNNPIQDPETVTPDKIVGVVTEVRFT